MAVKTSTVLLAAGGVIAAAILLRQSGQKIPDLPGLGGGGGVTSVALDAPGAPDISIALESVAAPLKAAAPAFGGMDFLSLLPFLRQAPAMAAVAPAPIILAAPAPVAAPTGPTLQDILAGMFVPFIGTPTGAVGGAVDAVGGALGAVVGVASGVMGGAQDDVPGDVYVPVAVTDWGQDWDRPGATIGTPPQAGAGWPADVAVAPIDYGDEFAFETFGGAPSAPVIGSSPSYSLSIDDGDSQSPLAKLRQQLGIRLPSLKVLTGATNLPGFNFKLPDLAPAIPQLGSSIETFSPAFIDKMGDLGISLDTLEAVQMPSFSELGNIDLNTFSPQTWIKDFTPNGIDFSTDSMRRWLGAQGLDLGLPDPVGDMKQQVRQFGHDAVNVGEASKYTLMGAGLGTGALLRTPIIGTAAKGLLPGVRLIPGVGWAMVAVDVVATGVEIGTGKDIPVFGYGDLLPDSVRFNR